MKGQAVKNIVIGIIVGIIGTVSIGTLGLVYYLENAAPSTRQLEKERLAICMVLNRDQKEGLDCALKLAQLAARSENYSQFGQLRGKKTLRKLVGVRVEGYFNTLHRRYPSKCETNVETRKEAKEALECIEKEMKKINKRGRKTRQRIKSIEPLKDYPLPPEVTIEMELEGGADAE